MADGHLGCFQFGPLQWKRPWTRMDTHLHLSGEVPRGGKTTPHGRCICNILRNCPAIFQSSCTCQQGVRVPELPHPHQHLIASLNSVSLILATLTVKWWHLILFQPALSEGLMMLSVLSWSCHLSIFFGLVSVQILCPPFKMGRSVTSEF